MNSFITVGPDLCQQLSQFNYICFLMTIRYLFCVMFEETLQMKSTQYECHMKVLRDFLF